MLYGAVSTEEGSDKGKVFGVLAYYIRDIRKTLAVMWADPYMTDNYWNIRLYDGQKAADYEMFSDLQDRDPIVSYETIHRPLGSGLKVIGSISEHELTKLEIHVHTDDVRKVM